MEVSTSGCIVVLIAGFRQDSESDGEGHQEMIRDVACVGVRDVELMVEFPG